MYTRLTRGYSRYTTLDGTAEDNVGRKTKSITQKRLEVLSARVDFEVYKRVEVAAQARDLSITQIVRTAVREWLERAEKKAA